MGMPCTATVGSVDQTTAAALSNLLAQGQDSDTKH